MKPIKAGTCWFCEQECKEFHYWHDSCRDKWVEDQD